MASILLAGTPQTTVTVARALIEAQHSIVGVLCPFPKPVGRKKTIMPCELETWAVEQNIPVFHVNREVLQHPMPQLPKQVDILVVADFGYLIPAWLLAYPKHGALNLHPSLLPRWRGATPVPLTLLAGDTKTGITVIKMNKQFDEGAVVTQREVPIEPHDTTPSLLERAFTVGATLLVEILPDYLDGSLTPIPQPKNSPTPLTRRFTKDDGYLPYEALQQAVHDGPITVSVELLQVYNIPATAEAIDRMVRALTPWPGVWTTLPNGKRVKILETHLDKTLLKINTIQYEGKMPERATPRFLK